MLFYVGLLFFALLIFLVLIFMFYFAFVFREKKDDVEWVGSWLGSGRSWGRGSLTKIYCIDFFFEGFLFSYNKNARKYQELVQLLTNAARNRLLSLS